MSEIVDTRVAKLVGALGTFIVRPGEALVVGRGKDSDLRLNDGSVSRAHARIDWPRTALAPCVEDLGSSNGTAVDSVLKKTGVLKHGSEVRFGSVALRVQLNGCGNPDASAEGSDGSRDTCHGQAGMLSSDGAGVELLLSLEEEKRTGVLDLGGVQLVLYNGRVALNRDSQSAKADLVRVATATPKGTYFSYRWRASKRLPDTVRLVSPASLFVEVGRC